MDFYPSRKTKKRKLSTKSKKRFILITNFWLLYLILISVLFIPNSSTYSNFNDTEQIANSLATLPDFCSDEEYRNNNKNECKKKDNSGIGNGPEDGDDGENGDPDNPGKGNDDKKDCLPEECVDDHPNNNDPKDSPKDKSDKNNTGDNPDKNKDSEPDSEEPVDIGDNNENEEADSQNEENVNESGLPEQNEQSSSN